MLSYFCLECVEHIRARDNRCPLCRETIANHVAIPNYHEEYENENDASVNSVNVDRAGNFCIKLYIIKVFYDI
jgi:hypothetical protein